MAGARSECSTWRVEPRRSSPSPEPLPPDVFETVVDALASAVVADYKEDENDTVMSPRGTNRRSTGPDARGEDGPGKGRTRRHS